MTECREYGLKCLNVNTGIITQITVQNIRYGVKHND